MRAETPPRKLDYQPSIAFHSSMQREGKLEFLQVLRLCAAGLVLLHHAVGDVLVARGRTSWTYSHADVGTVGFLIFFVLSGYVIALQIDKPPLQFAWHRLLRIYPPYFAAAFDRYNCFQARFALHAHSFRLVDAVAPGRTASSGLGVGAVLDPHL